MHIMEEPMNRPPGPLGGRLAGNGPVYDQDRLGFMVQMSDKFGAIWSFDRHIVVVADPALAGEVLTRTNTDFGAEVDFLHRKQKDDAETKQQWASSRAARMRYMRPSSMQAKIPRIAAELDGGISSWGSGEIDVVDRMRALTARVGAVLCLGENAHLVAGLGRDLFDALTPVVSSSVSLPLGFPLPRHRRVVRANRALEQAISEAMGLRRTVGQRATGDLVDVLMQPTARHGVLPDAVIRETLAATLLASENTSAAGFGWIVYELTRHPEIQRMVAAEAAAVLPTSGAITHDHYERLSLTARVVREALRLWPPNWMFARHAMHETVLGGYTLESGTKVMVPAYVMQRDARWFPDPLAFDPDRWLPDGSGSVAPQFAYMPFGAGPLICMGMSWSLIEMTLATALLTRAFHLAPSSAAKVVPDPSRGLSPSGLRVRLTIRPDSGNTAALPTAGRTVARCPMTGRTE
ncbi:cytochrome P450 [Streptomyces olivaceus]|uniref:cytochrome P450 n=1 Tax=Streptomyces olivaceus TaxID=47716 RepID=UPI0036322966